MTRIAILSDIHGNSIALEAVLKDIQSVGGVDEYFILGDITAIGFDPVRALELVSKLPVTRFARGNTDRFLVTGERPLPSIEALKKDPESIPSYFHMVAGFAWTQGAVTLTGWMPWLAELPLEIRTTLPDGTRFLGVHASPGTDTGQGINPSTSRETLADMAKQAHADLVCVGHTHWPLEINVDGVHFFNLGSVSNPVTPSLQASYGLLEANTDGYQIQHRYVDYDHDAVIQAVKAVDHPAKEYIIDYQLGKNKPPWVNF